MKNSLRQFMIFIMLFIPLTCCIASDSTREKIEQIDQLQLQEDMQRFYARFTSRIIESSSHDDSLVKDHGEQLLRQYINYNSEALKIVSSPYPVANFLDMLVFIKLNKMVLRDYWLPKVYDKKGIPLYKAFVASEKDLEAIAGKFMKKRNLNYVDQIVKAWRRANPDYIQVERIRMADFTKIGLIKEQNKHGFSLKGIIVDTEGAVKAVDEAVLVSNRAIFIAQNIPQLMRLQMRLGAQEVITDAVSNLQSGPGINHELERTRPFVHDLTSLASESDTLVKDLKSFIQLIREKKHKGLNLEKNLNQMDGVLVKADSIVKTINSGEKGREKFIQVLRNETRSLIGFILLCVIVAGFFISLFWWGGKYLFQKRSLGSN